MSAAARHFIDRYFPGDYKLIPNGVDLTRFDRAVPIARWQDGTRNLLFVGRHEPRKGLLDLLKAYRLLRKTGCDCRLLVVGSGRRSAKPGATWRPPAQRRRVPRPGERRAKAQLFKNADVYVSPATGGESFGIVLLEAMASGTPIVGSDIHGYKGVVRRGREALLVPPRSPKALAGAMATLLNDDAARIAMGQAGRARAEEFSWPQVTARVESYYNFVIRRLAAGGQLPEGYSGRSPPSPRGAAGALPAPAIGVDAGDGSPPDRAWAPPAARLGLPARSLLARSGGPPRRTVAAPRP